MGLTWWVMLGSENDVVDGEVRSVVIINGGPSGPVETMLVVVVVVRVPSV